MQRNYLLNIAIACALLVFPGCAGTQTQMRMMESSGELRVTPEVGKPYDYTVTILNRKDIGYDPDNIDTRNETALRLLKEQCPNGSVFGETVINTGTYGIGTPARTYFVQVKCNTPS